MVPLCYVTFLKFVTLLQGLPGPKGDRGDIGPPGPSVRICTVNAIITTNLSRTLFLNFIYFMHAFRP